MAKIPLNKLQPGWKLAAPVLDSYGNPLIGADTLLTEKHLRLMKTWGVESVEIAVAEPTDGGAEPDAEQWEACRSELLPIFIKANLEHPVMKEIFRLSVRAKMARSER